MPEAVRGPTPQHPPPSAAQQHQPVAANSPQPSSSARHHQRSQPAASAAGEHPHQPATAGHHHRHLQHPSAAHEPTGSGHHQHASGHERSSSGHRPTAAHQPVSPSQRVASHQLGASDRHHVIHSAGASEQHVSSRQPGAAARHAAGHPHGSHVHASAGHRPAHHQVTGHPAPAADQSTSATARHPAANAVPAQQQVTAASPTQQPAPAEPAAAQSADSVQSAPGGVTNSADAAEPEAGDANNRNSMGFQITSITQSRTSTEADGYNVYESGDDDVSDTVESRAGAGGEGAPEPPAAGGPQTEAVDGGGGGAGAGRLNLPLSSSPPQQPAATGRTSPRELTASPGVTGAEVLPVIPTIDGFGITLVPGALETVDSHAPGTAEIVQFPAEIEMDLMPTGLTVGVAPSTPGDGNLQETWQGRFKVVKIETNVPFRRGRWQCMDYLDQPEGVQTPSVPPDGSVSGASSAHSSVQLNTMVEVTGGEPPHPAGAEEATLPGLSADELAATPAPRAVDVAEPPPPPPGLAEATPGAAQATVSAPQASDPVPSVSGDVSAVASGVGGVSTRDVNVTLSAPTVYPHADRSVSLGPPRSTAPPVRLVSEPASPEDARHATAGAADGVPVFSAAAAAAAAPIAGLTLPDLLPSSSLLELVHGTEGDETADSASLGGNGTVADKIEPIDNKIEQAMDLVKSHLLLAVREEVDVLKASITKLLDKISILERENEVLKANATPEVLEQLDTQPSQAPSPTPTPAPQPQPASLQPPAPQQPAAAAAQPSAAASPAAHPQPPAPGQ